MLSEQTIIAVDTITAIFCAVSILVALLGVIVAHIGRIVERSFDRAVRSKRCNACDAHYGY